MVWHYLLWYHSLPISQTNLTFVDLCHQRNTFDPFSPNPRGDVTNQSQPILQCWSCIETQSSLWKELYEVENRWCSVLLWDFIRNKTFPRGSVFSGCLLPWLLRESQGLGKVDSAGVQHHTICEQKKTKTCYKSRRRPLTNVKESSYQWRDVNSTPQCLHKHHDVHGWL